MIRPRGSDLLLLTAAALVARIAAALAIDYSPYTDPAYYAMVAEQLATGHGFSAPVLWSFLEVGGQLPADPTLPVPSNGHWMPLTSIVAAAGMALVGPDLRAGQLAIVALGVALVPFTYFVGIDLYQSRRVAVVAAILAVFAGPLLIMYPTVDNFAVFGAAGAAAIWAAIRATRPGRPAVWLALSGAAVGLATLARVDGLLLAIAPLIAWLVDRGWGPWAEGGSRRLGIGALLVAGLVGVAVMAPWLARNLATFGSAFPSAGGHTLWITSYNEQFSISTDPSLATYLDWGLVNIIGSKLATWWELFWRTVVLLGGIFGFFFFAGLWRDRRRADLAPFIGYWWLMFFVMGAVFTFHAPHGAYYHSAGAWLPFAFPMAVAATGPTLTALGRWWRFLTRPPTHRFVEVVGLVGAVVLALVGSAALYQLWDTSHQREVAVAAYLDEAGLTGDTVMYGDPSSLWHLTGNPGVAAPFDPYPVIEDVVRAYDVRWVIVALREEATVDPLGLWNGGEAVDSEGNQADWLADEPAFEADGVRVFAVVE
ncbi:MAG TPA: glycosyltransferase family 39 protein [Candidatus Limnocylindria bacterium]